MCRNLGNKGTGWCKGGGGTLEGGVHGPLKIFKTLKKNYFVRVNHMMTLKKIKFIPFKKFTLLVKIRLHGRIVFSRSFASLY
jgi:hypothetical protein